MFLIPLHIVVVLEAQHVGKLVAYQTDAILILVAFTFPSVDFSRAGKSPHLYPIIADVETVFSGMGHDTCMRPDVALVIIHIYRRITGIKDVNHVDYSVTIAVVTREIHLAVGCLKNLCSDAVGIVDTLDVVL